MDGALTGCRVLDLTDEKGMLCSRFLAEMGAEVIRLEAPGSAGTRRSPEESYRNAGKKSVSLELRSPEGKGLFHRLVQKADVVVESGAAGIPDIDFPTLNCINPSLVAASISDFGRTGPYRNFQACDLVVSALGGAMYVSGEPDTPPLKLHGDQAYNTACLFAGIGILLALRYRQHTGRGQHVDISAMECVTATLDHVLVRYLYEGTVARRQGGRHRNGAFGILPCRDGDALLSLARDWDVLAAWLDAEGMADDLTGVRWRDRDERLKHSGHVFEVLERWTRGHTVTELVEKGQLMGFPWAEVAGIGRVAESPQLAARDYFTGVECSGKNYRSAGPPCRLSRTPWLAGGRVAARGEQNEEVYQQLGLSLEEIRRLEENGII
ncbi:MAG: CoA transferase [Chloroflexi bacterium]|nr:CoA transferase [Chloroflexota bacterium]